MDKKELKNKYKQIKPDMGVFMFKCCPTKKVYLGFGQNIKADINSIKFQLNFGGYHKNSKLQADWKEHGESKFETAVLETLEYDTDESKTDYTKDLESLREMVAEKYSNFEYIN